MNAKNGVELKKKKKKINFKNMKFTFKQEKPTGRYRSFNSTTHIIKLKRKQCGYFFEKFGTIESPIFLAIEKDETHDDGNPNCKWMNIALKKRFEKVEEAKEWLINNTEAINSKYKLHLT